MRRIALGFVLAWACAPWPALAAGEGARGNAVSGEEIWAAEQAYVERLEAGDVEGLSEFWHGDFSGWPSHAAEPLGTEAGKASMRELLAKVALVSARIRPLETRSAGDAILVHYLLEADVEGADGARRAARYRITHTWVRDGGSWKILGGMSAETAPDE